MPNLPLSIVMASMATLSTTMLGLGQRSFFLPALTLSAAIASILLTDLFGWLRLNRIIANVAMVLAAFFSLNGFLESGSHEQLLAIANLLIYVQIVLLFQEKSRRIYGQLAMFSLLQVVVAALLNDSLEFGFLLVVYMIIALFGFALFFLYREVGRVGVVKRRRSIFEISTPDVDDRVEGVPGALPAIEVVESGAVLSRKFLMRRIAFPVGALVGGTLVFVAVFFYTTPRTGGDHWESGGRARNVVGFSPEMSFDDMGGVLLSNARVMRVSFENAKTGEPYPVIGEPYFRGGVLVKYLTAGGRGQWRQATESSRSFGYSLSSPPNTSEIIRQDVLLEPTGDVLLFSMYPVYAMADTPEGIRVGPRTRRLYRTGLSARELREEYRFSVATTALRFGTQNHVTPHHNTLTTEQDRSEMEKMLRWQSYVDSAESFPKLTALAEEIVRATVPNGNSYEQAKALESHFLESDQFRYSLDFDDINAKRDFNVDPIEDFVSNHRTGHCEYFASALTLMLRSQGIPARMIIGYRGGEFNYIGNYYVVRQRDAHAWVEAYLKPSEIPERSLNPSEQHAGGGWLRLDSTPQADEDAEAAPSMFDRASKSLDYARWLWSDYVLRLTSERQQRAILSPLALDQNFPMGKLVSAEAWQNIAQRVSGIDLSNPLRGQFSWRGGLAAVAACFLAYIVYRVVRSCRPLLRLILHSRRPAQIRRRRRAIAFYQRFETLLADAGMRRDIAQTQREFARAAADRIASDPECAASAAIPERIVEAFYRARFSEWTPNSEQVAEIQQQLEALEKAFAP